MYGVGSGADEAVEVLDTVSQSGHKIVITRFHDLKGGDVEVEYPALVDPEMEAQVVVPYSPRLDQRVETLLDACGRYIVRGGRGGRA